MKFRKKPVIIDAIQFLGNDQECIKFCPSAVDPETDKAELHIPTLEGEMICSYGDWIIKGVQGEFYPCKPDIFKKSYEKVK